MVLPGVREAVAREDWTTAAEQLGLVRAAIERGTVTLSQALQTLAGAGAAASNPTGLADDLCAKHENQGSVLRADS